MKQTIFFLFMLVNTALSATPIKVDEKIQKQFAEAFPAARQATWYSDKTHHEVVFFQEAVQCRIIYRLDGTIERTERYYSAKDLAPFVLARITAKYTGYKVYGVTEFTTVLGVVYHLILEGEQRWLHVRTDDTGSSTIVKRVKKQVVPIGIAQHK